MRYPLCSVVRVSNLAATHLLKETTGCHELKVPQRLRLQFARFGAKRAPCSPSCARIYVPKRSSSRGTSATRNRWAGSPDAAVRVSVARVVRALLAAQAEAGAGEST